MPLEEGVFQKQSPCGCWALCLHCHCSSLHAWHWCCLGHLHISFAEHFVDPDCFGTPLTSSLGATGRGLTEAVAFACLHTQMQMATPAAPLRVYFPVGGWSFTMVPDYAVVGAAPGAPLWGVCARGHPKQLQCFLIPTQTFASPQIFPPYLTEAGGHGQSPLHGVPLQAWHNGWGFSHFSQTASTSRLLMACLFFNMLKP